MSPEAFLSILSRSAMLKTTYRHCDTAPARRESVADHSWRTALMAMLLSGEEEFRAADMDKVIRMCLIHDLGEAFTGDIPTFVKTNSDRNKEDALLRAWVTTLPEPCRTELSLLFAEMEAQATTEARIYKALDGLEALIQHNEADISTWSENEYLLNLTYCDDRVGFSDYLTELREEIRADTVEKIRKAQILGDFSLDKV